MAGDLLLSLCAYLAALVVDCHLSRKTSDVAEDRWTDSGASETRNLQSSADEQSEGEREAGEAPEGRLSGSLESLVQHSLAVVVALAIPVHSPPVVAVCGLHLLSFATDLFLSLRETKWRWTTGLLCQGANLAVLALAIAERVNQAALLPIPAQ